MMDMITHILAVAVALLAAVCLKLCHTIDFKNKRLVKFINENSDLKDAIMDMELEIQRRNEVIRALRDRKDDSGKDSPRASSPPTRRPRRPAASASPSRACR